MICPECGTYQPDRAKFCGLCGTPLSQDGLVESFLRQEPEEDIVLPRHRSPWFYLAVFLLLSAALAVLAGAVFLVYRTVSGNREGSETAEETQENTASFHHPELGFGLTYPEDWNLEQGFPAGDELAALRVVLTSRKFMEVKVLVLDPVVTVGGLEGIREYLEGEAEEQVRSLGGTVQDTEAELFTYTRAGDMPAFYLEFEANLLGERTAFILCYVVGGNYCFRFEGRAPYDEYRSVRPLFWSIIDSVYENAEAQR
ncbi:MAG: zinc ribbon domain-containing protein [Actinomycetota bacterium]|nr:zinc ribbon domain-containing protein [Actinomycetota bacterium]MDI7251440.1 zinc ribbon domain-containing protein [Actinomycetota bacterium]